ncbi:hypothetical protein C4546_03845 [Candidatus Parcubacteria bacterium]|jgi:SAM-dependent methyltransferase|nr:MAG: hypothetical protein C4546_03845 [Candidatus Parcubacteria bacterium]
MWFWLIFIVALFVLGTMAWAGLKAAPWVPTRSADFERILKLAEIKAGQTIFELGAGEGRLLKVFSQTPAAKIIGYEISILPFLIARWRCRKLGHKVELKFKDFFQAPFAKANVIFCFLTPTAMRKLKTKFEAECEPGTQIISYAFSVPGWNADAVDKPGAKDIGIYKYTI